MQLIVILGIYASFGLIPLGLIGMLDALFRLMSKKPERRSSAGRTFLTGIILVLAGLAMLAWASGHVGAGTALTAVGVACLIVRLKQRANRTPAP